MKNAIIDKTSRVRQKIQWGDMIEGHMGVGGGEMGEGKNSRWKLMHMKDY